MTTFVYGVINVMHHKSRDTRLLRSLFVTFYLSPLHTVTQPTGNLSHYSHGINTSLNFFTFFASFFALLLLQVLFALQLTKYHDKDGCINPTIHYYTYNTRYVSSSLLMYLSIFPYFLYF